jgi:hypothetical protein
MRIELPYVTVELDDRLRQRLAHAGEQLRINVTAYMRSAADDVDAAGERLRVMFDAAARRVNATMASATSKIASPETESEPRLR